MAEAKKVEKVPEPAPAPAPAPETKPYRLKAGMAHGSNVAGDVVQLTDRQAAAFRDKFEPAGGGAMPVNESRFPGEAKDEQGSAHGAQKERVVPAAPAAPPPLTAKDTPLPSLVTKR